MLTSSGASRVPHARPSRWRRTSHQPTPRLASAYVYVATFGSGATTSLDRASAEVDEALRLDPTPAVSPQRTQQSCPHLLGLGCCEARSSTRRSRPRHATLRHWFDVGTARALGHPDEALVYFHEGLELDPLRVIYHIQLAMLTRAACGAWTKRAAAAKTAIAISPTVSKSAPAARAA